MIKCVVISDTHTLHRKLEPMPEGDILIFSGDFSMEGRFDETSDFMFWLACQSHRYKEVVWTSGNHDWMDEKHPTLFNKLLQTYFDDKPNCHYLQHGSIELLGEKIFLSSWTKAFCGWAFNASREQLIKLWSEIPNDTSILVTHGPAFGILDVAHKNGPHLGDGILMNKVLNLEALKLFCFGHIHGGFGTQIVNNIICVNASIVDEAYKPVNRPTIIELE